MCHKGPRTDSLDERPKLWKMYIRHGSSNRETERGGMDRIDLAQDRHQWRALKNTVMNFRPP
jgi:hypothetical protein